MLMVIDIGNSNVVAGVYEDKKLLRSFRIRTDWEKTSDEYGTDLVAMFQNFGIDHTKVDGIIMSSVVPPVNRTIENMCYKYFGMRPIRVRASNIDVKVRYDNPSEVGSDRLINAIAAKNRYGLPCITIDFGTATTFSAMDENGVFVGGPICPGMRICTEALFQKSAKLTWIELKKPERIVNTDTVSSMQAGVTYGYIGLVDYIVRRMSEEMGWKDPHVVATGGMSVLIGPESETIQHTDADLTLEGLRILYETMKEAQ